MAYKTNGAEHRGPGFVYELIRRTGQKRINIRISQSGKVIVSAPRNLPGEQIATSVAARQNWVLKHLDNLKLNRERNNPLKRLLLRGEAYPVTVVRGKRKRGGVLIENGGIIVDTYSGDEKEALPAIEKWLIATAREELEPRAREISGNLKIPFNRLFFRNQRTRWGSSSGRGNISINWRIIMTPPPVQDYLIVHELCHQRHMNHSAEYWKLVKRIFPGYTKAEAWLKANRGIMGLFRET